MRGFMKYKILVLFIGILIGAYSVNLINKKKDKKSKIDEIKKDNINVADFDNGIYIINVTDNNSYNATKRFVVYNCKNIV